MSVGTLALRVVVGSILAGHGLQKLKGSFGGPGLVGTEEMMKNLAMHPAALQARAVALTETVGGIAVAVGAATPVAAAGVIATMVTAIRKVHYRNGMWNTNGGYEYNAVLIAAVTAVVAEGPGLLSLDALAGKRRWGSLWALFAIGAGVAGSLAAVEVGKRSAAAQPLDTAADDAGTDVTATEGTEGTDDATTESLTPEI